MKQLAIFMFVFKNVRLYPTESRRAAELIRDIVYPIDSMTDFKLRNKNKRIENTNGQIYEQIFKEIYRVEDKNYFAFLSDELRPAAEFMIAAIGVQGEKGRLHNRKQLAFLSLKLKHTPAQVADLLSNGIDVDWVNRFMDSVNRYGIDYLKEDERQGNGKKPVYSRPEIIQAVCDALKTPSPDGFHWKGQHVQALLVEKFGFQEVPYKRAAEILQKAKKIIRTKSV